MIKYLFTGIAFGIIMTKAEVISWFRIQEMFHFHSFHMYGIIGSAVIIGIVGIQIAKITKVKTINGSPLKGTIRNKTIMRNIIGGLCFGIGWAFTGACPGPVFVLIGHGYGAFALVLFSALIGTLTYGILKNKLPH